MAAGRRLLVIAPTWPSSDSGYGLAVRSSLVDYLRDCDAVDYVGITPERLPLALSGVNSRVVFHHIPIRRYPAWLRFGVSLFTRIPAVAVRFASKNIKQRVSEVIKAIKVEGSLGSVVFEDVPLCVLMEVTSRLISCESKVVLRSHNVLGQAFEPLAHEGFILKRYAWRIETRRIERFEKNALRRADKVLAISEEDAREYRRRYGIHCDGVLPVRIDTGRYAKVKRGSIRTILSVGSADIRKGHGLRLFVSECWPEIKAQFPTARLVLAGRGTEIFQDPSLSVEALGYVEDEIDVMNQGTVFLNTQMVGSGVKLKSLVAMASGKLLVSTPKGVEGIAGVHGTHFVVCNSVAETVDALSRILSGSLDPEPIIDSARSLIKARYSLPIGYLSLGDVERESR